MSVGIIPAPCPDCGGSGYKTLERDGHTYATECDCQQVRRIAQMLAEAGIPKRYENCSLAHFEARLDSRPGSPPNLSVEKALQVSDRFVTEYPVEFGLLFVGPAGVGKTHLAVAVLRDLIQRKSVPCLFRDFRELLKQIRESYNPTSRTSELAVLAPVIETEVLLLDGMEARASSAWVEETVSYIINARYNAKRKTLITAFAPAISPGPQTSAAELEAVESPLRQFGPALYSRLCSMSRLVEIQAEDYRVAIQHTRNRFKFERE